MNSEHIAPLAGRRGFDQPDGAYPQRPEPSTLSHVQLAEKFFCREAARILDAVRDMRRIRGALH